MKNWIFGFCCCISQLAFAQQWFPLGEGVRPQDTSIRGRSVVYALAVDSIHNLLYVGGDFYYAGDTFSRELALWDGNYWVSSEKYTGGYFIYPITALVAKHHTVYYASKGVISAFINDSIRPELTYPDTHGTISCMTFFRDTLYAAGDFGILKYNGKKWVSVGAQIGALIPPRVESLCVYNDQLIMGGLFRTIGKLIVHSIASWDGTKWSAMENGVRETNDMYGGDVAALAVYKGKLIASGNFDTAGTAVCQQFAQWNGQNWSTLDDNKVCDHAWQMLPHDSLLYVVGTMFSGGTECLTKRVATWNGSEWKDLNFYEANDVYAVAFFDNQLTIGFDKSYSNPDSTYKVNYIAKADFATSTILQSPKSNSFQLYPNPTHDELTISFPFSNNIITISDLCGSGVKHFSIKSGNTAQLNISSLQEGVYALEIRDEKGNIIASEKLFRE